MQLEETTPQRAVPVSKTDAYTVMLTPWIGIPTILAAFAGLLAGLRRYRTWAEVDPEWTRKIAHVVMGGVTLTFPWVFDAVWPVVVLSALALALMIGLRLSEPLHEAMGRALYGVDRASYGELCFPAAIGGLFFLSGGDPILFCVPILLLGLADPAAAAIGLRHGRILYTTDDGIKSGEGSAGFFLVAFFCVHVPLLLGTDTGRLETLLIATIVGLLVTSLEAISWRGLDNLFVPIGGYVLLLSHMEMEAEALLLWLAVIAILFSIPFLWYRRSTLNGSASFMAALVGYVTWSVGGLVWLAAPGLLYFGYTTLWPVAQRKKPHGHRVHNVLGVASVGLGWLFLAVAADAPTLLYPYTIAYAAFVAVIGIEHTERFHEADRGLSGSDAGLLVGSTARSALPFLPLLLLLDGFDLPFLAPLGMGLVAAVGIAVTMMYAYAPVFRDQANAFLLHLTRALLVAGTSSLGLIVPLIMEAS
jgi:phytol kinase